MVEKHLYIYKTKNLTNIPVIKGDYDNVMLDQYMGVEDLAGAPTYDVGTPVEINHDGPLLCVQSWSEYIQTKNKVNIFFPYSLR